MHKKKERRSIVMRSITVVIDTIDFPFLWMRKLTIPPSNEEDYEHNYLIIWPILGIPFIVFNLFSNYWAYLYSLPFIIFGVAFFWKFPMRNEKTGLPKYFLLVVCIGVFCAILWTKICCALLVDSLTFVGRLTGLSSTYLGLTLIAIGNAIGDGLTTIALAKKG